MKLLPMNYPVDKANKVLDAKQILRLKGGIKMNTYGLKAIKMAGGEETPRFEAKITENGKVIGVASNDGGGGCKRYWFENGTWHKPPKAFDAFIKQWAIDHKETFEVMDAWVYEKLDDYEELKKLKRWSKTKTPFRLKGDRDGSWRLLNKPYSLETVDWIMKKHGSERLEVIYNNNLK